MTHAVALGLVCAGCALVVASVLGAVTVRGDIFTQLHFLTPATSAGVPLVGIGLCIQSGQPWVIAELLVITVMLVVSGPVIESAVARAAAQRKGIVGSEQPE